MKSITAIKEEFKNLINTIKYKKIENKYNISKKTENKNEGLKFFSILSQYK